MGNFDSLSLFLFYFIFTMIIVYHYGPDLYKKYLKSKGSTPANSEEEFNNMIEAKKSMLKVKQLDGNLEKAETNHAKE